MKNIFLNILTVLLIVLIQSCSKESSTQTSNTTPIQSVVKPNYTLPTFNSSTDTLKEVTAISVKITYTITDLGGTNLTENGICWSTNSNPTISDNKKTDTTISSANKITISLISGLKPQTKYYFRPFATNSVGTAYGKEITVVTDTLNNCFSTATIFNSQIVASKLLNDGKILIITNASEFNNKTIPSLIRLNIDGTIDNSFNYDNSITLGNSIFNKNIIVQSDGKYIICYGANNSIKFIRINSDGSIDKTYNSGYFDGSPVQIEDLKLQSDNKLLVCGNFQFFNGKYVDKLIRVNTDGAIDSTFKTIGYNSSVKKIAVNSDGKIFVAGLFSRNGTKIINGIMKLNIDGSVDNTFDFKFNGTNVIPFFNVIILPQNKLLVSNQIGSNKPQIQKFNFDGTIDNTFSTIPNIDLINGTNMSLENDNFIYFNGAISIINGFTSNGMARISLDGTVDKTLNVGEGFTNNNIGGTLFNFPMVTNDKKIIVFGNFDKYNGKKIKYFTKINYDGSVCN